MIAKSNFMALGTQLRTSEYTATLREPGITFISELSVVGLRDCCLTSFRLVGYPILPQWYQAS